MRNGQKGHIGGFRIVSKSQSSKREDEKIIIAAQYLKESTSTVALTGAGISVGSGIPPFRGPGGLWEKYDPEEYAHVEAFKSNPAKVWIMLREMLDAIRFAKPNPAHFALAELERMGKLKGIITGNVDFLHQAAGSTIVHELHGNNRMLVCMKCRRSTPVERYEREMPPLCDCKYPLRPQVVLFGEQLPEPALSASFHLAGHCDIMLVVGTSSMVSPMSHMPFIALENNAKIIEINPDSEGSIQLASDLLIQKKAEDALPKIVDILRKP